MECIYLFSLILIAIFIFIAFSGQSEKKKENDMTEQTVIIEKKSPVVKNNIVNENIGISIMGQKLAPFINKGEKVPCKKSYKFSTSVDNQQEILLSFYRGTGEGINDAIFLGKYGITRFEAMPAGEPIVEVTVEVTPRDIVIHAKDLRNRNILSIKRLHI